MKSVRNIIIALFALITLPSAAQTAAVKKAAGSVFALTTFNADGSIHSASYGVFTGKPGEGIAAWSAFNGAQRAIVVDARGQQHEVDVMIGASEMYDLCRFRIKDGEKEPALPLTATDAPATSVTLVGYSVKKATSKNIKVERAEKFQTTLNYYVFNDNDVSSTDLGCPVINEQGELLGIMQRPSEGGQAFSADARLTASFQVSGLSVNDPVLRATGIRPALPDDEQQATVMLMLSGEQNDSVRYDAMISDFIRQFPTSATGYDLKAGREISQRRLADADNTLQEGVKQAAHKDEALSNYAKQVYAYSIYPTDSTFTLWNMKRAQELAEEAYKNNPLPVYRHQQAQAIFAQGDYQQALNIFTELQQTDLGKNGEVFYEAAQCKTQLKAPKTEILQLLDQAVNVQPGTPSAPYVLTRGQIYDEMGETRKAFMDYLRYDSLMNNNATADFYYLKFSCEMKLRQYQLALNDIAHAIVLNRTEPTYYAEMASLQLRVNKLEDAVRTCDLALSLTDKYADLYLIKGIALCEQKKKEEGLEALRKAQELGDPRAADQIKKYQ